MVKKFKIKPVKGFKVRKPDGDFLKEAGELVAQSSYWRRRIQFKEVELVSNPNAVIAEVDQKKVEAKKKAAEELKKDKEEAKPKKVEAKKEPAKKVEKKETKKKGDK